MSPALARFNLLSPGEAEQQLLACCASRRWAAALAIARPFADVASLVRCGERVWWELSPEDWLEAIASHPRIGERPVSVADRSRRWSEEEQAKAMGAERRVLQEISAGNAEYELRFGFRYLVCASGRSAGELLAVLHGRLDNDPESELAIAAEEQRKITRLRLHRLLEDG